jgi:hypothetical protein
MSFVGIDLSRTVPVTEDLTTRELSLAILRGTEKMYRVDKKLGTGVSLLQGEWAVLNSDGTLSRPAATPVASTYLVFSGTDRFDVHATGQATIIMNSAIVVKSNRYYVAGTYDVGTLLTVKDLGAGQAVVSPAGVGDFVVAKVIEVGTNFLVYETVPSVVTKMQ